METDDVSDGAPGAGTGSSSTSTPKLVRVSDVKTSLTDRSNHERPSVSADAG